MHAVIAACVDDGDFLEVHATSPEHPRRFAHLGGAAGIVALHPMVLAASWISTPPSKPRLRALLRLRSTFRW